MWIILNGTLKKDGIPNKKFKTSKLGNHRKGTAEGGKEKDEYCIRHSVKQPSCRAWAAKQPSPVGCSDFDFFHILRYNHPTLAP